MSFSLPGQESIFQTRLYSETKEKPKWNQRMTTLMHGRASCWGWDSQADSSLETSTGDETGVTSTGDKTGVEGEQGVAQGTPGSPGSSRASPGPRPPHLDPNPLRAQGASAMTACPHPLGLAGSCACGFLLEAFAEWDAGGRCPPRDPPHRALSWSSEFQSPTYQLNALGQTRPLASVSSLTRG